MAQLSLQLGVEMGPHPGESQIHPRLQLLETKLEVVLRGNVRPADRRKMRHQDRCLLSPEPLLELLEQEIPRSFIDDHRSPPSPWRGSGGNVSATTDIVRRTWPGHTQLEQAGTTE